jgi:Na+-translocating ferredoxin:NAD+ oxidoreductase RnfG subunit
MKRTTIRTLALVLCTLMLIPAGTAAKGNKHKTDAGTDSVLPMSKVHEAFPAAKSCKKSNNGVYKVYGKNDKVMGALVVSTPFAAGIKGFAGPTPLLIAVGKDMHVKSVNMLPNAETPNFQQHVVETGLLKTWNGLTLKQAASKDVDAVTGATFTSTAVIRTMRNAASSAKVDMKEDKKEETGKADSVKLQAQKAAKAADSVAAASNAVNIDSAVATSGTDTSAVAAAETETAQPEVDDAIPTSVWIKNISTVVVALLGLVLYFRPSLGKKWRLPLAVLSVVVLGFWQKSMLSLSQFIAWMRQGIPVSMQWGLLVLAVLSIALPIFFGKKYYCVYVCPFGGLQEIVGKVNKHKLKISQRAARIGVYVRRAVLIALLLTIVVFTAFDFSLYEPLSAFNFITMPNLAPVVAMSIAIAAVVLSIIMPKPWCKFVCPLGQTLDLFMQPHQHKQGLQTNKGKQATTEEEQKE